LKTEPQAPSAAHAFHSANITATTEIGRKYQAMDKPLMAFVKVLA
jgi:hypothetical protein